MLNASESEILVANWQGPHSWPGFEIDNNLPPLPDICGVYLQTFEYNGGYIIYCAGHAKNVKLRFATHERKRRVGDEINVFDVDKIKEGIRSRVWNGYSDWWKTNASAVALAERQRAIGYSFDWGNEIPSYQTRKAIAFAEHWRMVSIASSAQCRAMRLFIAEFGPGDRLRKRLEAGVMNALYSASPPFCDIPDRGMALSRIDSKRGEKAVVVDNRSTANIHALPIRLVI
ncbi:hypothetical protein KKP04_02510 [Rhodomicrobium sp. Az07]|uniref:hypothetical protein n=1 Tax=Rhodomicrobium sp. Az07 TaxID=2839034 RepID=UPI001BE6AD02|nr:hypothetical protein [Rhodomicrobium sp. Az07]MBT3069740.1 hypothetical protein [Rhodomicrobium sp. Az07]